MLTKLKQYSVQHVWHFTDKSNLDLIIESGGILSLKMIEERNVNVPVYGGNEWSHDADLQKGLDKYVNLTFLDDHPMLYIAKQDGRITQPIWLQVDVSIIQSPNVMYSTDVSNKSGVSIIDNERAKNEIDFDVLFTYMDWRDPEIQQRRQAAIKSEILVPQIVPIDKILGYKNG